MRVATKLATKVDVKTEVTRNSNFADLAKDSSIHKKMSKSNRMRKYDKIVFEYINPEKNKKASCKCEVNKQATAHPTKIFSLPKSIK